MSLSVATWNVNSIRVRLDQLLRWLEEASPDVVCLQETKVTDGVFPAEALINAGYPHLAFIGQRTYNGVAIVSRRPLERVQLGWIDGEPDPQQRLVRATVDGVRIVNCYVPNVSEVGSDKYEYKLDWLERLRAELDAHEPAGSDLLLCGDMNVAVSDQDVYDPFRAEGRLLFTEDEKDTLAYLLEWGLVDAFRTLQPYAGEYSWWDYRAGGFSKNHGYRIDYVFLSERLMARCEKVQIWRHVRGWEQPSDHVPVMATLR